MDERGYIKLHRKSLDSAVFQCPNLWHLWSYLLMRANHKRQWVKISRVAEPIELDRGQLITGRYALQKALYPKGLKSDPHPATVWKWLGVLKHLGNLRTSARTRYTVITIVNYSTYNDADQADAHSDAQQTRSRRAVDAQQARTNKKVKKVKKVKKKPLGFAMDDVTYPDGLDTPVTRTALAEWIEYKKATGKAYKLPAVQLSKLLKEDWATDPGAIKAAVDHSIAQGYQGAYPPNRKDKQYGNQPGAGQRFTPGVGDPKDTKF